VNNKEYKLFMKTLEEWNSCYDEEAKMIKKNFSSPGYHTTLKGGEIHRTREALIYAVELLDSGIEDYKLRAIEVLWKVVPMQDTNPGSKTYGIWPWFLEEPLERMSPPDWNWADFCGKELLQIELDHKDRIPEALVNLIKEAIIHASRSIMRRNMGPHYTNISIMGTYVTLLCGEHFSIEDIFRYGVERLKNLYTYNLYQGAFTEYNSPNYNMIAIEDLTRMLNHIKDKDCLEMIKVLHKMGWECAAKHFHKPTRQWAGPHSRYYSSIIKPETLVKLQIALGEDLEFIPEEEMEVPIGTYRIGLKCPEEFKAYFYEMKASRAENITYVRESEASHGLDAFCYMTPKYALSAFNKSDLWNQRRAVIAYWGTVEKPSYMRLRCLHDGYDYTSAIVSSVMDKGNLLSIVNFALDGGDTHTNLDMIKNSTIKAKDLRLRLEFGGFIENLDVVNNLSETGRGKVNAEEINIYLSVPYCRFGNYNTSYEVIKTEERMCIDVVMYSGEERKIDFSKLSEAACAFAVSFSNKEEEPLEPIVRIDENNLELQWKPEENMLTLNCPVGAKTMAKLFEKYLGTIENTGSNYEMYIEL
jgi:hypothetical protein